MNLLDQTGGVDVDNNSLTNGVIIPFLVGAEILTEG